jgi:putative Holliday junction resolvase
MPRVLAVDPGEARVGLAVSDITGTIARPLHILRHRSRSADVVAIIGYAQETGAARIIVGIALDQEGNAGPQARRAMRLIEALRAASSVPVEPWDESGSTRAAGASRARGEPDDARAAAVILQDYLDAQKPA